MIMAKQTICVGDTVCAPRCKNRLMRSMDYLRRLSA